MSFRTGLLASTSRVGAVALRPSPLAVQFRAVSTSADAKEEGSVQALDKQLEAQVKQRERALKSMPRGYDVLQHVEGVVMEPTVDPPAYFKIEWARHPVKWSKWLFTRFRRMATNNHQIKELIDDGLIPWYNLGALALPKKVNEAMAPSMDEFKEKYEAYCAAQGTGNGRILAQLASGQALRHAEKIAKAMKRKGPTYLLETNTPPVLQSVRYAPLMGNDGPKLAQCVVTFDTTQSLTTSERAGSKKTTKQRVVQHIVFERTNAHDSTWKIKGTVNTSWPNFDAAEE